MAVASQGTKDISLLQLSSCKEEKRRNTEITAFVYRKMAKWKKEYFRYLVRKYFPSSPSSNSWFFGKNNTRHVLTEMEIFQSGKKSLRYLLGTAVWKLGISDLFPLQCSSLLLPCLLQNTKVLSYGHGDCCVPWEIQFERNYVASAQRQGGILTPAMLAFRVKYCCFRRTSPLWKGNYFCQEKTIMLLYFPLLGSPLRQCWFRWNVSGMEMAF